MADDKFHWGLIDHALSGIEADESGGGNAPEHTR